MKYYYIAMVVFCIQLSAMFWHTVDPFGLGQSSFFTSREMNDTVNDFKSDKYYQSAVEEQTVLDIVGDMGKGLWAFVKTFGLGLVIAPYTLVQLGVPTSLAVILGTPVMLLYIVALAQLLLKSSGKGMA